MLQFLTSWPVLLAVAATLMALALLIGLLCFTEVAGLTF